MLKSKIASRRWIILDSFHITELNQTPLQSKRTVMALQFSQPEDVKTLQLRERASAVFSPRQKRLAEPDPCYSSSSLCLGLGSQICLINFVSCNMGQVAGLGQALHIHEISETRSHHLSPFLQFLQRPHHMSCHVNKSVSQLRPRPACCVPENLYQHCSSTWTIVVCLLKFLDA